MKKILTLMIALLILVGCMPTHENEVVINFEKDYSGTIVLSSTLETDNLEDPTADIEEKITKVVEDNEKFKPGTLKTKKEQDTLVFTYTEDFKDLEDLSKILTRIYDETIVIDLVEEENLFQDKVFLEGFDFDASEFADDIYDAIEAEELFAENSSEARTSKKGYSFPDIYFDGDYVSLYSNFSNDEYKHIDQDSLFIQIVDEKTVNLMNVIESSDDLDLNALELYYRENYSNRVLSKSSSANLQVEKDIHTNSLTFTMENVLYEHIEDLQYEIFNRFIEVDKVVEKENSKKDIPFELEIFDMGHSYEFDEIVLNSETMIDTKGFKIVSVDGMPYTENTVYEFYADESLLTLNDRASFTIELQKGTSFSINNILQYVIYGIIAILAVLFIVFITVKVTRKNNKSDSNETQQRSQHVDDNNLKEDRIFNKKTDGKLVNKMQSSIFSKGAFKHAVVLLIVTLIATALTSIIFILMQDGFVFDSELAQEYIPEFSTIDYMSSFRVLFAWITTGGLSATMFSLGFSSLVNAFGVFLYPLLIALIIVVISTLISLLVFKTESKHERNKNLLSGTVLYGLIVIAVSFIPVTVITGGSDLMLSIGMSVRGNALTAIFITIPLYFMLTSIMITFKNRFTGKNFEISGVVFEGFKRFMIMFILALITVIVFYLIESNYPLLLIFNATAILLGLASGATFEINEFSEISRFGLVFTDEFSVYILIAFILVAVISIMNIQKVYRNNNIVSKGRFSLIYALSIVAPIYVLAAICEMRISATFLTDKAGFNYASMFVSFFALFTVIFIATNIMTDKHPYDEPEDVFDDVVVEEIVIATPSSREEQAFTRHRPMQGRRHRRRS